MVKDNQPKKRNHLKMEEIENGCHDSEKVILNCPLGSRTALQKDKPFLAFPWFPRSESWIRHSSGMVVDESDHFKRNSGNPVVYSEEVPKK